MTISRLMKASFLCLFSASLFVPIAAHAQMETSNDAAGYAGLLIGLAKPEDVDARLGYGAEVGIQVDSGVSAGGFFLASKGDSVTFMHYGLAADYHFFAALPGLRAGLMVGANTASIDTPLGDDSDTKFMAGPRLGFDYVVTGPVSVGAEVAAPYTFGDSGGFTIYALASIKYWF